LNDSIIENCVAQFSVFSMERLEDMPWNVFNMYL